MDRTTRLLFARELRSGALDERSLSAHARPNATADRSRRALGRPLIDRLRLRSGRATHRSAVAGLVRARHDVLGANAAGPARVLLRVDEFPRAGTFAGERAACAAFARFEAVMAGAGLPYLLAVTPRVARDVLDPRVVEDRSLTAEELAILASLPRERVAFGLHGYDHRTRVAKPRRRSEFDGLAPAQLAERLDRAHALLAALGINPRVLVPPFNRFEAGQFDTLAARYDVVCAGPETVAVLGLQPGPAWRGDAVLLPSYPPAYGRAAEMLGGLPALLDRCAGLWIAVVVHWGWESDAGLGAVEALVEQIAPHVEPWSAFLDEVAWSRG